MPQPDPNTILALGAKELRPLTAEEAGRVSPPPDPPPTVKKLSMRHHNLARLLARGVPKGIAASCAGYVYQTVRVLEQDPAFQELVEYYRREEEADHFDFMTKLRELGHDGLVELQERLEREPETLTPAQLLEIVKVAADRTGHGPSSTTQVNVNVGLAERLKAARERVLDLTPIKEIPADETG